MALATGTRLGAYEIGAALGAGGMGEVYVAKDESLDRNVALKVLPAQLVRNEERVRRFIIEAKSASSLNHPNIVTMFGWLRDEADFASRMKRRTRSSLRTASGGRIFSATSRPRVSSFAR